ncbi:MAG: hypothetical protein GF417_04545 [Candidatus Latescibacteria bacterium]|nr:hypothetical protein [bacterium]MBD3423692.1 hypothetical protein [Candidatus Latescibacterota bacterium]
MTNHMLYKYIFLLPITAGAIAQFLKMIVYSVVRKRFDFASLFRVDGMPNLHSTVFSSLLAGVGIKSGYSTLVFSVVTVYGITIIHDNIRLNKEKEKQVRTINIFTALGEEFSPEGGIRIERVLQIRILDIFAGAVLGGILAYTLIY